MNVKTQFLNYATNVLNEVQKVDISDNKLSNLAQQIEQAELIVPIVGGFSAGKSSLINAFLGSDILPTKVTPETALATELRYSEQPYIEAITEQEQIQRYELSQFEQLKDNAQQFKFIKLFLNHPKLKEIQPLVLVDMPGFDAPLAHHNKAIANYLIRGVYFIFLTSVEDGTITLSMSREIQNLQNIGKGFSFCLSKTNLRSPNDVTAVAEQINEQLKEDFDFDKGVVLLDNNGGESLHNILKNIDPEQLFKSIFIERLKENYEAIENSIRVTISTLSNSKEESENAIATLENSLKEIEQKKISAINEVKSRYGQQSIEGIISRITQTLMNNKDRLVSLAMVNQAQFSTELSDIVRNCLITEVQQRFAEISRNIVEDFQLNLKINLANLEGFNLGGQFIDQISQTIQSKISNVNVDTIVDTLGKLGSVIGTLATTLAPILRVVLAVLPSILANFFNNYREEQAREQARQQAESQFTSNIIPSVQHKIRQELPPVLNRSIEELINEISQQFENQMKQKRNEIAKTAAEKQAKAGEISAQIEKLEQASGAIKQFANSILF